MVDSLSSFIKDSFFHSTTAPPASFFFQCWVLLRSLIFGCLITLWSQFSTSPLTGQVSCSNSFGTILIGSILICLDLPQARLREPNQKREGEKTKGFKSGRKG